MIAISNRQPRGRMAKKIDLRLLERITSAALEELKIAKAELGIVLVGAKESASLNEKFLGHEGSTDVITFDYSEGAAKGQLHGEIFICVAEAEKQAKEFKTDWRSEVVRYVVHGILHLIGHDDLQPAARKKMKLVEGRLVRELSRRFALSKL
jgi:probable rRNA maturation factor